MIFLRSSLELGDARVGGRCLRGRGAGYGDPGGGYSYRHKADQRMFLCDMIDRCEGLLICYDYVVRPQQISYIFDKRPCGFLNFHVVALCMPEPE